MGSVYAYSVAFVWGLAEATVFFLVPDIWLSVIARTDLIRALIALVITLAGALFGGTLVYLWGANDPAGALSLLEKIPAISHDMIARVGDELNAGGGVAVILGPLSGTPYKLYAAEAASAGLSLPVFLVYSLPARCIRFLIVVFLASAIAKLVQNNAPRFNRTAVLIAVWGAFYTFYFTIMPN